MRKNLTEIVFILDRSGSMSGLERDTIGGFNSMIEQQKKAEGEALISTVLFDNVSEVLHDRVNVKDIRPMTDRDYTVRGCTALFRWTDKKQGYQLSSFVEKEDASLNFFMTMIIPLLLDDVGTIQGAVTFLILIDIDQIASAERVITVNNAVQ